MYIIFFKICFIKKFIGYNVVIVDFFCCVINRNENIKKLILLCFFCILFYVVKMGLKYKI